MTVGVLRGQTIHVNEKIFGRFANATVKMKVNMDVKSHVEDIDISPK